MNKDNRQDRIDDYLLDRTSREERLEFEEEVTRNAELSAELADTELAMAAIELAGDRAMKARLQQLEATLSASDTTQTTPAAAPPDEAKVITMQPRSKGTMRLLAYAAALLLVLAVGWWAMQTSSGFDAGQLAMESFEPYQNITTGTVRGSDELPPEAAAFADYDAGNYAAAAEKFSALPATDVTRFYQAQSLLAQEKFAEAAALFAPLAQNQDFSLAPEATYYNGLALLGQGKVTEAREVLTPVAADAGHPMQQAAKALLAKM